MRVLLSGAVSKYLRKTEVIVFLRLGGAELGEEEPKAMSMGSEWGRSDISIMAFGSISTSKRKELIIKSQQRKKTIDDGERVAIPL